LKSGSVVEVQIDRKLAIVEHSNSMFGVIGWAEGTPVDVGHLVIGDMGAGGWGRLVNASTGDGFLAYKHLHGCPRIDAHVYFLP
jgi:hypothetical protein